MGKYHVVVNGDESTVEAPDGLTALRSAITVIIPAAYTLEGAIAHIRCLPEDPIIATVDSVQ